MPTLRALLVDNDKKSARSRQSERRDSKLFYRTDHRYRVNARLPHQPPSTYDNALPQMYTDILGLLPKVME